MRFLIISFSRIVILENKLFVFSSPYCYKNTDDGRVKYFISLFAKVHIDIFIINLMQIDQLIAIDLDRYVKVKGKERKNVK